MRKVKRVIAKGYLPILIVSLLCFNKCKIHCQGFPEEYKVWFPYTENQELCFTNNNDTSCISVEEYYVSEAFSYSSNCDCSCGPALSFYVSSSNVDFKISIEGQIDGDEIDTNNVPRMYLKIYNDPFLYEEGSDATYSDSLYIQSVLYYDVLTIRNTKGDSGYEFSEIKVVKNYGIMAISDYEGNTWYLNLEE
jgi:hypothetical protein